MKAITIFIVASLVVTGVKAQYKTSVSKMYSANVKDSFEIYISVPANHNPSAKFDDIIYYMDANLKSGNRLRELVEENQVKSEKKFLYVGIGHIGNYHQLRRRDFILPFIENGDTVPKSKDYGQIALFHRFLSAELIPSVDKKYSSTGKRTIIGHSLGGLFVVYSMFRNEGLFNRYFALSPSLWIDSYNIFSFNKIVTKPVKHSHFFMAAGSNEQFNYILAGLDKMKVFMKEKNYENLAFEWQIYTGTHNSYIRDHLQEILQDKILVQ